MAVIALAATVPFIGKAFHIDDALYLAVARQIIVKPWDPFGAEVLWEKDPESLFDADFNPPLWNYLMAAVLAVTGEPAVTVTPANGPAIELPVPARDAAGEFAGIERLQVATSRTPEIALHLLEGAFVAAAIIALFLLARRWVRWPLAATALVALSPAWLPGQNVMLEGPVMAFWLWGVWCHIRTIETDRASWTWASGSFAALGVLTKYTSGLVVLLLAGWSLRQRHWRSLWFLAVPAAAIVLWSAHNVAVYGRPHVLVMLGRAQTGEHHPVGIQLFESWGRLFATLRAIGAVTALALPAIVSVARTRGVWAALGVIVASAGVSYCGWSDMSARLDDRGQVLDDKDAPARTLSDLAVKYGASAHVLAFGALGAITLGGIAASTRRSAAAPDDEELLLWAWLVAVLLFGIFATPFLAVRHLLPGIPPLVFLALRRLDDATAAGSAILHRVVLAETLAVTVTCGFLVAKADYDFANWYRHVALDVGSISAAQGRRLGKEVWYTGHWGWAYYAERVGMRSFVPRQSEMHEGDFLLLPLIQTWDPPPMEVKPYLRGLMPTIKPKPQRPFETGSPRLNELLEYALGSVRSISTEVHFYSGGTLNLPWRFSRKPMDDFAVIEVRSDLARDRRDTD